MLNKNDIVRLRAHHLLCIEGFEGKGYNREFVENMWHIVDILNEKSKVMILDSCDYICKKCPNKEENICVSPYGGEKQVKKMDRFVIESLNIENNKVYLYGRLREKVFDVFKTKKSLNGVCFLCSWKRICKWYNSRK
ncbi:MAG: DUF1284 domain-containing protein [Elusimicrobiota bacterium]